MQQFLYRLQVERLEMLTEGPTPEETAVLEQHASYLQQMTDEGQVLLAGRTQQEDASTFGIVILVADSEQQAARLMAEDPAVARDLMHAELFPFRIALVSPLISR